MVPVSQVKTLARGSSGSGSELVVEPDSDRGSLPPPPYARGGCASSHNWELPEAGSGWATCARCWEGAGHLPTGLQGIGGRARPARCPAEGGANHRGAGPMLSRCRATSEGGRPRVPDPHARCMGGRPRRGASAAGQPSSRAEPTAWSPSPAGAPWGGGSTPQPFALASLSPGVTAPFALSAPFEG